MSDQADPPRRQQPNLDTRRHLSQTERNLVMGGFALALIIGGVLIWRFWGVGAGLVGLTCMGGIILVFGLLWGLLKLMEIWSDPERHDR